MELTLAGLTSAGLVLGSTCVDLDPLQVFFFRFHGLWRLTRGNALDFVFYQFGPKDGYTFTRYILRCLSTSLAVTVDEPQYRQLRYVFFTITTGEALPAIKGQFGTSYCGGEDWYTLLCHSMSGPVCQVDRMTPLAGKEDTSTTILVYPFGGVFSPIVESLLTAVFASIDDPQYQYLVFPSCTILNKPSDWSVIQADRRRQADRQRKIDDTLRARFLQLRLYSTLIKMTLDQITFFNAQGAITHDAIRANFVLSSHISLFPVLYSKRCDRGILLSLETYTALDNMVDNKGEKLFPTNRMLDVCGWTATKDYPSEVTLWSLPTTLELFEPVFGNDNAAPSTPASTVKTATAPSNSIDGNEPSGTLSTINCLLVFSFFSSFIPLICSTCSRNATCQSCFHPCHSRRVYFGAHVNMQGTNGARRSSVSVHFQHCFYLPDIPCKWWHITTRITTHVM